MFNIIIVIGLLLEGDKRYERDLFAGSAFTFQIIVNACPILNVQWSASLGVHVLLVHRMGELIW
jgi:hypothetical protein